MNNTLEGFSPKTQQILKIKIDAFLPHGKKVTNLTDDEKGPVIKQIKSSKNYQYLYLILKAGVIISIATFIFATLIYAPWHICFIWKISITVIDISILSLITAFSSLSLILLMYKKYLIIYKMYLEKHSEIIKGYNCYIKIINAKSKKIEIPSTSNINIPITDKNKKTIFEFFNYLYGIAKKIFPELKTLEKNITGLIPFISKAIEFFEKNKGYIQDSINEYRKPLYWKPLQPFVNLYLKKEYFDDWIKFLQNKENESIINIIINIFQRIQLVPTNFKKENTYDLILWIIKKNNLDLLLDFIFFEEKRKKIIDEFTNTLLDI